MSLVAAWYEKQYHDGGSSTVETLTGEGELDALLDSLGVTRRSGSKAFQLDRAATAFLMADRHANVPKAHSYRRYWLNPKQWSSRARVIEVLCDPVSFHHHQSITVYRGTGTYNNRYHEAKKEGWL